MCFCPLRPTGSLILIKQRFFFDFSSEVLYLLDGATGTEIWRHMPEAMQENDAWLPDLAVLSYPDIVAEIHRSYLAAGADIIKTCTFNSNYFGHPRFHSPEKVRELNIAATSIARAAADAAVAAHPSRPRFVAGSVGPTSLNLSSLPSDKSVRAAAEMREAYSMQIEALAEGGADFILIETIVDSANAEAAINAYISARQRHGSARFPKLMVSVTPSASGRNLYSGQNIIEFMGRVCSADPWSIGVNCCGYDGIPELFRELRRVTDARLSFCPNAGTPDGAGRYPVTPAVMAELARMLMSWNLVDIIGGCCGTSPAHISALRGVAEDFQ